MYLHFGTTEKNLKTIRARATWTASRSRPFGSITPPIRMMIDVWLSFLIGFWLSTNRMMTVVHASHQSINLDSLGHYRGVVLGFADNFDRFESQSIKNTLTSIMNQIQNSSDILRQLIGVQFSDVTIIVPNEWKIDLNSLQQSGYNIEETNRYQPISEADIIYTNDDKNQISTMQFGECGEGGLPVQYPMLYVSDSNSGRLLAHQWILYRYGVFNEFGLENDYQHPTFYTVPDGIGTRIKTKPQLNSCFNGRSPRFIYSANCNNVTDPITGRPVNPSCDVIPAVNSIQSSFMYSPTATSEFRLCNSTTHDYNSPTKHNVLCDYQSIDSVIKKHNDFDLFKPNFGSNSSLISVRFQIVQNGNLGERIRSKANVFYALSEHNSKFLESSMETIKKMDFFQHQASFGLFNDDLKIVSPWKPSSQLSMVFGDPLPTVHRIDLQKIFTKIANQFRPPMANGLCVFFLSGDLRLNNTIIDYAESLADIFNKRNIGLKVILYDRVPSVETLKFFDQLIGKMASKSSVDYAFGVADDSSPTALAFRTKLGSSINTVLFDLLEDLTEQTHILIKRQTVKSDDQGGIDFVIDSSISKTTVLIEMNTNGKSLDIATGFRLLDNTNQEVPFISFEAYQQSLTILYNISQPGLFKFFIQPNNKKNSFVTVSVRVLSTARAHHQSTKDGVAVSARCWIQHNPLYPLRGYVQLSKGLNGLVYDSDVTFTARSMTIMNIHQTQPHHQKNDITYTAYDNGRGNPDITARDGIYSAYLDPMLSGGLNGESYVGAYTITAKIITHRLSVKPGNYGNTVMFINKSRCCGSEIKANSNDQITNERLERIVDCGSFYYSMPRVTKNYAIRDLRIVGINAENRSVNVQWNSPFYSNDPTKPVIVKAFHSYSEHSTLPLTIKEGFDQENDEADIEVTSSSNDENNSLRQLSILVKTPEEGYYYLVVKERNDDRESKPSNIVSVYLKSNVPIENTTALAIDDSHLSDGPYRENMNSSLTWIHILIICITSSLVLFIIILIMICFTIKRHRQTGKSGSGTGATSTITTSNTPTSNDFKDSLNGLRMVKNANSEKSAMILEIKEQQQKRNPDLKSSSYYLNEKQQKSQDTTSLKSQSFNEKNGSTLPANCSTASQNTSCSSVNTFDNSNQSSSYIMDHQNQQQQQQRLHQPMLTIGQHHLHHHHHHQQQPPMKELNVATLLPNSWDAKELLDHWGRVQEAKLMRGQDSPPSLIHAATMMIPSNSPSVLSYEGSSSLENSNNNNNIHLQHHHPHHHHHHQQQQQQIGPNNQHPSYLCQPAIVQPAFHQLTTQRLYPSSMMDQQPSQFPSHHNTNNNNNHHHHQNNQQPNNSYSPYSNASSIWKHQQQQQQQQHQHQQQQQQHQQQYQVPLTGCGHLEPAPAGYDDNGLPEYSVVRKVHPNISQV